MSSSRPLLSKWCTEYMSPVVVTACSAEVEKSCLQNGLLFHELLSAFGHLDGIHATVRATSQIIHINDAHIRFERITEAQAKSPGCLEEALRLNFNEFDMNKLPATFEDLRSTPPSGWTHEVEQRILHSGSFSEYEMISQPLCLLTAVSTADADPMACMQELCSTHHAPMGFKTGQYDPDVQRIYMIIHDSSAGVEVDTALLLRQMKSKFSPTRTKLLFINSLSEDKQNYQQPDIWTRWKIPLFYPQHAPTLDPTIHRPIHPSTGEPSLGSRLSMEDFMSLRNYCIEIYQQDLLPQLERRIGLLTRIVNDTKKGVKNVLKNFWRKPRDENLHEKGSARYRYDRVESQILLLSDTAFSLKDYDFAMTHYKLVRDDFKADKSVLYVTHCCIMIAACQFLMDPMSNRGRELISHLEAVKECLSSIQDSGHMIAYYSVILAELYTAVLSNRNPLEAAAVLLQASAAVSRLNLLSALLSERAALFCIQAGQFRKYSFHHVLAGNKYYAVGNRAMRHSMVCYACVLLLHDSGKWSGVKSKLFRILADELKSSAPNGSRRAVLLMLRVVNFLTQDTGTLSPLALSDAVSVLYELLDGKFDGDIEILSEWKTLNMREVLLDTVPVTDRVKSIDSSSVEVGQQPGDLMSISETSTDPLSSLSSVPSSSKISKRTCDDKSFALVHDISVPTIVSSSVCFLEPVNGSSVLQPFEKVPTDSVERSRSFAAMELDWMKSFSAGAAKSSFIDSWVKVEDSLATSLSMKKGLLGRKNLLLPMGESLVLRIKLSNRFPVELQLKAMQLTFSDNSLFEVIPIDVVLQGCESRVINLVATPRRVGKYEVLGATWFLSESLQVVQSLEKPGPKLQKTLRQRVDGLRGKDDSLTFEVVPEHPLLRVDFRGVKSTVLQGELVRVAVSLVNEGHIAAGNVVLKMSLPCVVFEAEGIYEFLSPSSEKWNYEFTGSPFPAISGSSTVIALPPDCIIPPGTELKFYGWVKMDSLGVHNVSLSVSYYAVRLSGNLEPLGPANLARHSLKSHKVKVLPSLSIKSACHQYLGKEEKLIQLEISSNMSVPTENLVDHSDEALTHNALCSKLDSDLEENKMRVECLWVLGGAKACNQACRLLSCGNTGEQSSTCIPNARVMRVPLLDYGETYCTGVAVDVIKPDQEGVRHFGDEGIVDSTNVFWGLDIENAAATEWMKVIDRFLSLADANSRFQVSLALAREKFRGMQESLEDSAPRTISQVRKDKNKDRQQTDETNLSDLAPASNTIGVQGISDQGVLSGEVILAVGWVANCGGVLRRGIHVAEALSIVEAVPSRPSAVASDFVTIQVTYSQKENMKLRKGQSLLVPVTLVISSSASVELSLNVEATDTFVLKRGANVTQNNGTSSGSHGNVGSAYSGSDLFSPNIPVKGIRWEGKVRHKNVPLPPFGSTTIKFNAVVTRPGLYDLKNFRVTASFPDSDNAKEANKDIVGQCLICVTEQK